MYSKFQKYLADRNIPYRLGQGANGKPIIRIINGIANTNVSAAYVIFFGKGDITIQGTDICLNFPHSFAGYELLNGLNHEYRYCRFFVPENHSLKVQIDLGIVSVPSEEEIFSHLMLMTKIVDDVFPRIMRVAKG